MKLLFVVTFCIAFIRVSFAERWIPLKNQLNDISKKSERSVNFKETVNGKFRQISVSIPGLYVDKKSAKNHSFAHLRLPHESSSLKVGQARLPVIRRLIKVPDNTKIDISGISADIKTYKMKDLDLKGMVFPSQESHSKGKLDAPKFTINKQFYKKDAFVNESIIKVGKLLRIKGELYRTIELFPFNYNPVQKLLKIASNIDIKLKVGASVTPKTKTAHTRKGLLIITGNDFYNSNILNKFVAWKKSLGFFVKLVSISQIPSQNSSTNDIAIRNFLLQEYKSWKEPLLDYLLIVGDVEHVPSHQGTAWNKRQYTDNFYATLDSENYKEDLTSPDISVGRFAVKTLEELTVVINKTLRYEAADFQNMDWIKKVSFIGTSDSAWNHVAEGTHNYVIDTYTKNLGFKGIFPNNPNLGGDKLYAIPYSAETSDLVEAFNDGRSIINYSGHGSYTLWAGPDFSLSDINKLNHSDAIPYVISNACITGSFAMQNKDSFAEMWLKAEYGALAFFGASNNSYWSEDDILERAIWDHLLRDGAQRIGDINYYGMEQLRLHYNNEGKIPYYYEIYNLMGDPTTPLFTEIPTPMHISTSPLIIGSNQFNVHVSSEKGNVERAVVHISNIEQGFSKTAITDDSGLATFEFDTTALAPGKMKVTVSAFNHIVTHQEAFILTPESSFIVVDSYSIQLMTDSDIAIKSSTVGPYDRFHVQFSLKNIGNSTGQSNLSIVDLPIGVSYKGSLNGGCDGLNIDPGTSITCQGTYLFEIDRMLKNGTRLEILMKNQHGDSENNLAFLLPISSPDLTITEVLFSEKPGNLNGNLDPGESGTVTFKIKNVGGRESHNDKIFVDFLDTCLESEESTLNIGTVAPDETVEASFQLNVSNSCLNGDLSTVNALIFSGVDLENKDFVFFKQDYFQIIGTKSVITHESSDRPLSIPDNTPSGVTATLYVEDSFIIDTVKVYVDIKHTYRGDLIVTLISPEGKEVILHKRSGGSTNDLLGWYGETLEAVGDFELLKNSSSKGQWKLKIADMAGQDTGTLDGWKIFIDGYER